MNNSRRWIRGFSRLAALLFAVTWIFLTLLILNNNSKRMELLWDDIVVFAGRMPLPGSWPVLTATDKCFSTSIDERQRLARAYFEGHVEPLAKQYYFDTDEFKAWFIRTATLSLDQAPLKKWQDPGVPTYVVRYREIPADGMPGVQIWRAFLDKWIVLLSMATALVVTFGVAVCVVAVRWIVHGFRKAQI
jgi:hypothetical protein